MMSIEKVFLFFLEQCSELFTEILIAHIPVYPWTGFFYNLIVFPVIEHAGMQWPLGAAPWFPGMDCASISKKNAMAINCQHLYGIAGLAPEPAGNHLPFQAQMFNHSFLIILVKRNGCFPLAAITTLLADKYF